MILTIALTNNLEELDVAPVGFVEIGPNIVRWTRWQVLSLFVEVEIIAGAVKIVILKKGKNFNLIANKHDQSSKKTHL